MSDAAPAIGAVAPPAKKAKKNVEFHVWTLLTRVDPLDWEDYLQGAPDISVHVYWTEEAALDQVFDKMKSFLLEECEDRDSYWSNKTTNVIAEMLKGESPFSFVKHCTREQMEKLYDWICAEADFQGITSWQVFEHGSDYFGFVFPRPHSRQSE